MKVLRLGNQVHSCDLPDGSEFGDGALLECEVCSRRWLALGNGQGWWPCMSSGERQRVKQAGLVLIIAVIATQVGLMAGFGWLTVIPFLFALWATGRIINNVPALFSLRWWDITRRADGRR